MPSAVFTQLREACRAHGVIGALGAFMQVRGVLEEHRLDVLAGVTAPMISHLGYHGSHQTLSLPVFLLLSQGIAPASRPRAGVAPVATLVRPGAGGTGGPAQPSGGGGTVADLRSAGLVRWCAPGRACQAGGSLAAAARVPCGVPGAATGVHESTSAQLRG